MKNPYAILIKPIFSEDSDLRKEYEYPQYTFKVAIKSNKHEIKHAIEEAFKVKVLAVNTIRLEGKKKRVRIKQGKRPDWKKAIITLDKDQKIELA